MARFAIPQRLSRLSPRERRMATIFGVVVGVLVFVGLPGALEAAVISRRSDVTELRAALDAVQSARAQIRERQSKKDSIALRYVKRAPVLAGFIEELARAQKLEVTEFDRSRRGAAWEEVLGAQHDDPPPKVGHAADREVP